MVVPAEQAQAYLDVMGQPTQDYVDKVVEQQMDGLTRADIVELTTQQYAGEMGVDEDTILSYIDEMSDEELFDQVEQAIAQQVREQYAAGVEQRLSAMGEGQLAAMLDVAQTTYSDYERGKLNIPLAILRRLALLYNTSIDYLLELTDEKAPYPRALDLQTEKETP